MIIITDCHWDETTDSMGHSFFFIILIDSAQ